MKFPLALSPSGLVLLLAAKTCMAWEIKFYSDQSCGNAIYTDSGDYETDCIQPVLSQDAYSVQFFPSDGSLGAELSSQLECNDAIAILEGCKPSPNPWRSYEINRYE
jgi:hypothetical protein